MKPRWLIAIGGTVAVLSIGLSLVHPWGDVRGAAVGGGELLGGSAVPQGVRRTLETKCADCHSNQTHWPVYSRLAPGSWLMERDVHDGRAALNLSAWNAMRPEDRISALARIAAEVRNREMPPKAYALMHPHTHITDSEQRDILAWTKAERKRVRASNEEQIRSDGQ